MALNSLGLGFVFSAKDFASPVMRKVEGRFKKMDATTAAAAGRMEMAMTGMAAGFGVAAVGAAGLGLAAKAANQFGEFEQTIAVVGARAGATAEQMDRLSDKAMKSALITQFSPQEAAAGLENFAAVGFTTEQQIKALDPALDLAAGGMISVSQAAGTMTSALKVFGKDVGESELVAGQLLRITNLTSLSASDLQIAMGNVSRGAGAAKAGIEQMLPAIGLVKNTGVDASVAATSVSSAFDFLAKNSEKIKKDFGVNVADAAGNFRDFNQVALEIFEKGQKKFGRVELVEKLTKDIGRFGKTAIVALGTQYSQGIQTATGETVRGADAIRYMREEMEGARKAAKKMRERMLDTFEGQKRLLSGQLAALMTEFGKATAAVLRPVVKGISFVVTTILGALNKMSPGFKKLLGIILIVTSAAAVLAGIIIMGAFAFVALKGAVMAAALPALIFAAKALAIVGVAALVLVGIFKLLKYAFDENIGGFGDGMKEIFGKVKLYFSAIGQLLSGDGKLRGDVLQKLLDPANKGVLSLVQRFQQVRFRVKAFFAGLSAGFQGVMKTAEPTFRALKNAFKAFAEALGFGSEGVELLTSSSGEFTDKGMKFGELLGRIAEVVVNILTYAINIATGAVEGLKGAWVVLKPVVMATIGIFFWLVDALNWVFGAFNLLTGAGEETDGAISGLGQAVGFVVKWFIILKAVTYAARAAWIAYTAITKAVAIGNAIMAATGAAAGTALLPVLAVIAAFAAGAYIGTLIDEWLGWSDAIAGVNKHLRMTEEELNKIGQTKIRGAKFKDLEQVAAEQGMTVTQFAKMRSKQIAKESTAQNIGLSAAEIERRMLAGEEVYQEVKGIGGKPAGAEFADSGIAAKKEGQADAGKAQQEQQKDAYAEALKEADAAARPTRPTKINATFKIGEAQLAQLTKQATANMDALDFEADMSGIGSF